MLPSCIQLSSRQLLLEGLSGGEGGNCPTWYADSLEFKNHSADVSSDTNPILCCWIQAFVLVASGNPTVCHGRLPKWQFLKGVDHLLSRISRAIYHGKGVNEQNGKSLKFCWVCPPLRISMEEMESKWAPGGIRTSSRHRHSSPKNRKSLAIQKLLESFFLEVSIC